MGAWILALDQRLQDAQRHMGSTAASQVFATDPEFALHISEVVLNLRQRRRVHYSTVKVPFIFLCLKPQNCEHLNGKMPAWSATNSTVTGSPFGSFLSMWKASIVIP